MCMKKLLLFPTILILVSCQPSELEKCIEANVKGLDEGEKILLELEEELDTIAPDLKLFGDFSTSLNLIYGQYPLAWEDGVELSKEGVVKWANNLSLKQNYCSVFNFDSMEEFEKCQESKNQNSTEDDFYIESIKRMRKDLKASNKFSQQAMIYRYFEMNHMVTWDDSLFTLDLETSPQMIKKPRKWTIGDMALIIKETIKSVEKLEGLVSGEDDEIRIEYWKANIESLESANERSLLLIKNSIELVKPKLAEDTCNSQGIY
jgi:hypothetical protein